MVTRAQGSSPTGSPVSSGKPEQSKNDVAVGKTEQVKHGCRVGSACDRRVGREDPLPDERSELLVQRAPRVEVRVVDDETNEAFDVARPEPIEAGTERVLVVEATRFQERASRGSRRTQPDEQPAEAEPVARLRSRQGAEALE